MKWIITALGMSIFLLLPSVAVSGTLNISPVSHRIIKITDKKVLLSLLPANTKLFPPCTFSNPLCSLVLHHSNVLASSPPCKELFHQLLNHTLSQARFFLENKSTKQKNPTKTPWYIALNFLLSSYFTLGQLEKYFLRTLSAAYFPTFHSPPYPNAGSSSCSFVTGVMVNTGSRQGIELII